jgi:FlaA1/EpsC-like NDP-sugar epimerase
LAKEMIRVSGLQPDKDIAIVFTGIRPGEKLFEEMLTAEEGTTATKYQRIFMAKLKDVNEKEFWDNIYKLADSLEKNKEELLVALKNSINY